MRHCFLALALLSAPAIVQAGELTLSPATVSVDNGQQTAEILLTYRPGATAVALEVNYAINLDRLGWADVQVAPSSSPDVRNWCVVVGGRVRAMVLSGSGNYLPAGTPIPLCRMRVRPHAHTTRGSYTISPADVYEFDLYGNASPVATNAARIVVF